MSWALFKANLRDTRTIWIIMTLVFCFYLATILSMYDPLGADVMNDMLEMLPEALRNAFGFGQMGTTLLSFIASYIYGFLVFLFPLVISVVVNHRLIASHVDKGSMAYLLATPNTRQRIAITQAGFSLAAITATFFVVTVFTIGIASIMHPGELNVGGFIGLNLYALLMYYAIGGLGFFASCVANESKVSLGLGMGLPGTFLVLQMLGNAGEELRWIGNLSLYALFAPLKLIEGSGFAYLGMAVFALLALGLYLGGILYFDRKDLHV